MKRDEYGLKRLNLLRAVKKGHKQSKMLENGVNFTETVDDGPKTEEKKLKTVKNT